MLEGLNFKTKEFWYASLEFSDILRGTCPFQIMHKPVAFVPCGGVGVRQRFETVVARFWRMTFFSIDCVSVSENRKATPTAPSGLEMGKMSSGFRLIKQINGLVWLETSQ